VTRAPDFELPNVATGPDPYRLSERLAAVDGVLLLFQRDDRCTNCRAQVRAVAERYDAFRERGVEVASILPEPVETAREWQSSYDLPYPLLADPEAATGDDYDQPVRFGVLGSLSDFLGRMPAAILIDADREVVYERRGRSTFDRPDVDDLLAAVDEALGRQSGEA
jgi:peroxiredoxin Q/BCP